MSVTVVRHMLPRDLPMSLVEFARRTPPYSVAIDGYVSEGPSELQPGPRQNFNHHEEVNRLATLATCQQVLLAIRMGFYKAFHNKDGPYVEVYMNDCDEDIGASLFCFEHPHLIMSPVNPLINRYVAVTGIMDATGGAYPLPPDLPYLEEHTWTVMPYLQFRFSGGLRRRNADEFLLVVDEVVARIERHVLGRGGSVSLAKEMDYEVIHRGTGWCMVKERGMRARLKMYTDGILAFVSISERDDGRLDARVGRFSPYIDFPVMRILEAYNKAEDLGPQDDRAGGSDLIGATSRNNGTGLSIPNLTAITEGTVRASSIIVP